MSQFYLDLEGEEDIVVNARILNNQILVLEVMISSEQPRIRKSLSLFVGALVLPTLAVLIFAAIKVIANPYFVPIAIVYLAAITVTYVAPISSGEQERIRRLLSFFVVALFLSALAVHAIATITIAALVVHAIATIAIAAYFAPLTTISVAKQFAIVAATSVTIAAYCELLMTIELAIMIIACLAYIVPIMIISVMVCMQYAYDVWRQYTIEELRVLDKAVQMADNPSLSNAYRRVNPEAEQHLRRVNPEGGKHLRLWNFSRAKQILLALTEELMSWRRGNAEVPSRRELLKQRICGSNS